MSWLPRSRPRLRSVEQRERVGVPWSAVWRRSVAALKSRSCGGPATSATDGRDYEAFAFPGCDVSSGDFARDGRRLDGATNELPCGPAWTACPVALPPRRSRHDRNHTVHPLSQVPAFGLPVTVTGSPNPARL